FANVANVLNHAMSQEDERRLVMTRQAYDFAISAADARFQRGAGQQLPDLAVDLRIAQGQGTQTYLRVNKGAPLNVHIDGKYSPVCGLQSTTLPVPFQTGLSSTINVYTGPSGSLITTGSEGFVVNWDVSQAGARSFTHHSDDDAHSPAGWFGCNQLRP